MRINYFAFLSLLLLGIGSCEKQESISQVLPVKGTMSLSTAFMEFSSPEELNELVRESNEGITTRAASQEINSICSVIPVSLVNRDLVLSVEIPDSLRKVIDGGDVNLYTDLGYESLLPEESFAAALNYRGEYAVNDTVYKVSPRGTFCMPKKLVNTFEKEYAKVYKEKVSEIGDGFYDFSKSDSISKDLRANLRLYDTFGNGTVAIGLQYERSGEENPTDTRSTALPDGNLDDDWIAALDIDWDSFDSYTTDAHTVAGKWIQSLFGRNKAFNVSFANNRRLKTKLYYYNYLGHTSIGAKAKFQKKNLIGWSGKSADHLYLIWSNVILKSKLPYAIEYPHTFKPTTRIFVGSNIEKIPGTNVKGTVDYYVGKPLSDKELKSLATENYLKAVIDLKMQVDKDFYKNPRQVGAIRYVCDNVVWTIIRPYGIHKSNEEKITCNFESDFHFKVGVKNFVPGLKYDVKEWLSKISAQKLESPKLIQGEIRSAATKNDETKGVRLVKK